MVAGAVVLVIFLGFGVMLVANKNNAAATAPAGTGVSPSFYGPAADQQQKLDHHQQQMGHQQLPPPVSPHLGTTGSRPPPPSPAPSREQFEQQPPPSTRTGSLVKLKPRSLTPQRSSVGALVTTQSKAKKYMQMRQQGSSPARAGRPTVQRAVSPSRPKGGAEQQFGQRVSESQQVTATGGEARVAAWVAGAGGGDDGTDAATAGGGITGIKSNLSTSAHVLRAQTLMMQNKEKRRSAAARQPSTPPRGERGASAPTDE